MGIGAEEIESCIFCAGCAYLAGILLAQWWVGKGRSNVRQRASFAVLTLISTRVKRGALWIWRLSFAVLVMRFCRDGCRGSEVMGAEVAQGSSVERSSGALGGKRAWLPLWIAWR